MQSYKLFIKQNIKPENIEQLISELFDGKFKKQITQKDVYDVFKQKNYYMFPEFKDGKIVAMLSMYIMKLFSRKVAVVEEVVTLKDYRNKGIGSKIVKGAIEKAKILNCDCLELTVRSDNKDVQKFYEELGFRSRNNDAMRMLLKNS